MSDLISRQDAIEAIEEIAWYHQNRNREMVSGANSTEDQAWYKSQDIYAALEALPSAEAVQRWIPVSEGLPKEGEPVLITDCGYVDGLAWVAKDGAWESDHAYTDSVTAWMPLPEPYKGGDEA